MGALSAFFATNFYISNMSTIIMTSTVFLINVMAPLGSELIPINYKYVVILFKLFYSLDQLNYTGEWRSA